MHTYKRKEDYSKEELRTIKGSIKEYKRLKKIIGELSIEELQTSKEYSKFLTISNNLRNVKLSGLEVIDLGLDK